MIHPDNLSLRVVKLLAGILVLPTAALLWLTVTFSFPTRNDYTNATAMVQSCRNLGPVSWRGFGTNWSCTAVVQEDEGERFRVERAFNFFTPEEIGTPQRIAVGHNRNDPDKLFLSQPEGWPSGAQSAIGFIALLVISVPALWLFSRLVVWSFKQEDQRKFWEKIYGTPEERAAKKAKDDAFWADIRRNRERRKEQRRRRKEIRQRERT